MFLRNVLTRARERATDPIHDPLSADVCRAAPSLLEEVAVDAADFVDLARLLRVDLATIVTTIATTKPTSIDELVTRMRGRGAAEPAPIVATTSPASTIAAEDLLRSVHTFRTTVLTRLTAARNLVASIGGRTSQPSWRGVDGLGWGQWARVPGDARAHRDGSDHATRRAAQPAALAP